VSAHGTPHGVVVTHSYALTEQYIGSPSIAVLHNMDYVASHDYFGPGSTNSETALYHSHDRGGTWHEIALIEGQWWSSLFVHQSALYLLGVSREYGNAVIRRSGDGGRTWSEPRDEYSGLLRHGNHFHCAPTPVTAHSGRLWRGMEMMRDPISWPANFEAFVMSIDEDADLLCADNWVFSNAIPRDAAWLDGRFNGWLEGNALPDPKGCMKNILRVDTPGNSPTAALMDVSEDGRLLSFDPEAGFIDFPGAHTKFTIRYDATSGLYWSLVNPSTHGALRNVLSATSSPDLRKWTIRSNVLRHADPGHHAFQYVDWLFDGDDMIALSRTAYDDDAGGAHNYHDANYLTFHRVANFRHR